MTYVIICCSPQVTQPEPEPEPEQTAAEEAPEEAPPAKAQKGGTSATPRGKNTMAPAAGHKPAARKSVPISKPAPKATKATGAAPRKARCAQPTSLQVTLSPYNRLVPPSFRCILTCTLPKSRQFRGSSHGCS